MSHAPRGVAQSPTRCFQCPVPFEQAVLISPRVYVAAVPQRNGGVLCGQAPNGDLVEPKVSRWRARIVEYETDHTDGMPYVDRMLTPNVHDEGALCRPVANHADQ